MKKIIYRVDDRFIHGQVLEGWVNYLHIPNVIIVNDIIAGDNMRAFIYKSTLPPGTNFSVFSVSDYIKQKQYLKLKKHRTLIIVGSVEDLYKLSSILNSDVHVNVGCISSSRHDICITDSVFVTFEEYDLLKKISENNAVYFNKVPWEQPVIFLNSKLQE